MIKFIKNIFSKNNITEEDILNSDEYLELYEETEKVINTARALYRALSICAIELYKITENVEHINPSYWLEKANDD